MDTKQPLTLFVVAILAASLFSVVGLTSLPLQTASAVVTIETSADDHGDKFFQGMLQVIIEDDTTDDDSDDSISVTITVEEDGGGSDSSSETIDDTSDGSQRFEFFLFHQDAPDQTPADPEHDLPGVLFDFGDGATNFNVTGFELHDSGTVEIDYKGQTVTIDYDESNADLSTDRDVFGTSSIVYLTIEDNDANLDPTSSGSFTSDATELDGIAGTADLFTASGLDFNSTLTFEETGDNSAVFEAEVELDADVLLTSKAVSLTLQDKSDYDVLPDADNTSTGTSQVSFTVDNVDGNMAALGAVTFGSEIKVTVTDNDQNADSADDESLDGILLVTSQSDSETVDLAETGDNTGAFVIDLSNDELRVTFVAVGGSTDDNGILELEPGDVEEDIDIDYVDCLTDDEGIGDAIDCPATDVTASATVQMSSIGGTITLPDTVGVNSDFDVTITDADLNDNPRTRDSYTVTFLDADAEESFFRGTTDLGAHATLGIEMKGDLPDFADPIVLTFIETGISTGIFIATADMADMIDSTGEDLDDGDNVEITYNDFMEDPDDDSADELEIGREDTAVDFSRKVLPIPPENDGPIEDALGSDIVEVTLSVTDADANDATGSEDEITVDLDTNFEVEVDGDGFGLLIDDDLLADDDFGGPAAVSLDDIMLTNFNGTVLDETGPNTGVFEETLEFVRSTLDTNRWQDMTLDFTYINEAGDSTSGGLVFRGNDGALDAGTGATTPGSVITITIQDEDLNLSDEDIEEFDANFDEGAPCVDDALLLIEAENDDIDQGSCTGETFTETGENTGVFTAEFEMGTDILVSDIVGGDVDQASNIHLEYDEEVDSAGDDNPDELELDLPVVTSTGAIQVAPTLVGPGTEITILITDADLNQDPDSAEDLDPGDVEDLVEFQTNRDEVQEDEIPGLEETGPDTGVFEFTIQLVAGTANDCENDEVEPTSSVDGNEVEMGACPGDLISLKYEDQNNAQGNSAVVSRVVEVSSWDPQFVADKPSYAVGDRVTISISDPDANTDPDIADSLRDIGVTSTTDVVGEDLSALETGADTGVFRLSFTLTSSATGGGITVSRGDTVEIVYTDEFPADFEQEESDKDFVFAIDVGGAEIGRGTTTPSAPRAEDVSGQEVEEITAGQQVVLATTVVNNIADDQPFVALIEVRDSNEVTVFIGWGTGILDPNDRSTIGVSWNPQDPGNYEVRTFVIDDFVTPQVLSDVETSDIAVS